MTVKTPKSSLKKILTMALSAALALSCMCAPAFADGQRFTDVAPGTWYYTSVEKAAEMGFVSGTSSTTFSPDSQVTNAQMMTMITRAFYKKSVDAAVQYNDGGSWWMPYAETAYIKGILKGMTVLTSRDSETAQWDTTVDAGMNRYDMAQILYNVMSTETTKTPSGAEIEAAKSKIGDWASVPAGYQQAVAACYAAGLLSGVDSNGTFNGNSVMTRAQAAVVMCRLCE